MSDQNIDAMDEFEKLKAELEAETDPQPEGSADEQAPAAGDQPPAENDDPMDDISWDDVQGDMDAQKQMINEEFDSKYGEDAPAVEFDQPQFQQLKQAAPTGTIENLDFILDIPLEVSVHLGRTKMLINDLLKLGQGSVIELNKLIGEPFDVYVNNKLVARGEVVVSNDKYGVRLTDIVSPLERIQQLG